MNTRLDTLNCLATTLELTTEGNKSLSEKVLRSVGWKWEPLGCPGGGFWQKPNGDFHYGPLPRVTEHAKAARGLIPRGLFVGTQQNGMSHWSVALYDHPLSSNEDYRDPKVVAVASTLPLALCCAAVKTEWIRIREGQPRPQR